MSVTPLYREVEFDWLKTYRKWSFRYWTKNSVSVFVKTNTLSSTENKELCLSSVVFSSLSNQTDVGFKKKMCVWMLLTEFSPFFFLSISCIRFHPLEIDGQFLNMLTNYHMKLNNNAKYFNFATRQTQTFNDRSSAFNSAKANLRKWF